LENEALGKDISIGLVPPPLVYKFAILLQKKTTRPVGIQSGWTIQHSVKQMLMTFVRVLVVEMPSRHSVIKSAGSELLGNMKP